MASVIDNLNSLINTKSQLNTILQENGQEGGEVFSEYPEQFRAAIAGAATSEEEFNSYISSYLDTYNYINEDALDGMSYVSGAEISQMGYITAADIPEVDLSSYVTYDYLSAQGYVTSVPAIDENIVPKETGTYTLGDVDHMYANTYTRRINSTNDGINIFLNNSNRFAFQTTAFKTNVDNVNLGTSSNKWAATYTYNLYADTIHNFIWTGTSAEYAALDNYTSYQIYMIKEA